MSIPLFLTHVYFAKIAPLNKKINAAHLIKQGTRTDYEIEEI